MKSHLIPEPQPIESYIHERTDADFTHGYCPECALVMRKRIEDLRRP